MKKLVLLCCFLGLISCKKELEKPRNFIERDKMTNVLYDFALLGGMENISIFYSDTTLSVLGANAILKRHQIDSATFAENNRYYIELGDESYFKIQEEIRKRLDAKKEVLVNLEKEEHEKTQRLQDEEKAKDVKLKVTSDTIHKEVSKIQQKE